LQQADGFETMASRRWQNALRHLRAQLSIGSSTDELGKKTLAKHSVYYMLASGVPGLVSFLSIAIYSRLLPPSEYGIFALVIANTLMVQSIAYQWIKVSITRFLPAYRETPRVLLDSILISYLIVCGLTGIAGLSLYLLTPNPSTRSLIAVGTLLLWASTWFDLNLEAARASLQPARYAWMNMLRSVSALLIGVPFVLLGWGAYGLLCGHLASALIASASSTRSLWSIRQLGWHADTIRKILRYGLPLTANFAVRYVITTSDRLLIGYFLGAAAAGLYAAGYDLGWRLLTLLFASIELAVTPLVFQAFERYDRARAVNFLSQVRTLTWGVSAPVAAALIAAPQPLVELTLGHRFRESALAILPWIALAYLFYVIMNFYNYAFKLGLRTELQVLVMAVGAGVNILLNLFLIPTLKLVGAAIATTIAFGAAALISYLLSQKVIPMRMQIEDIAKITFAVILMAGVLYLLPLLPGFWGVIQVLLVGSGVYLGGLWFLNPSNLQSHVRHVLNSLREVR
jgi:O-antigen/teichoic acid export membrane protein